MCHSMHRFATRVATSQLMIRETGCFGLIAASLVTFFTAALWDSVLQQPALKHNFSESYENLKNASPFAITSCYATQVTYLHYHWTRDKL